MKSLSELGKIVVEQIKEFVPFVISEFRGFKKEQIRCDGDIGLSYDTFDSFIFI